MTYLTDLLEGIWPCSSSWTGMCIMCTATSQTGNQTLMLWTFN